MTFYNYAQPIIQSRPDKKIILVDYNTDVTLYIGQIKDIPIKFSYWRYMFVNIGQKNSLRIYIRDDKEDYYNAKENIKGSENS